MFQLVTRNLETLKRYLFENWKRLRAPFCPYFLRSLPRESRLTHALSLQLPAQFCIELHQSARNAQLHRIGLAANAAAQNAGNDVEGSSRIRRRQWSLRRRALRRSHEIFFKRAAVHLELAAAWAQINAGNRASSGVPFRSIEPTLPFSF